MMSQLKPNYRDNSGKIIATLSAHILNGNLIFIEIADAPAITSEYDAIRFFSKVDFAAAGLASNEAMYDNTVMLGSIFRNQETRNFCITLYVINKTRFADADIPLYGWKKQLIKLAA